VFPLEKSDLLLHLLYLDLVALAQQRQMLAVAFFDCREQGVAEATHLSSKLQCLLNQEQAAHRTDRLVQPADNRANVDPCRCGFDQHAGINWRGGKGQLSPPAFDIHAVANLEESVGHRVPVAEELIVAWNAEVERAPNAEKWPGGIRICPLRLRQAKVERELAFELHQRIAHRVEALRLELCEGFRADGALRRDTLRPRAQNIRR